MLCRLASTGTESSRYGGTLSQYPGGAEANVLALLGQWGLSCTFFTALPQNELADKALQALQSCGVNTDAVLRQGDRMGLYFLLAANGLSTGQVVYDRKHSAFSQLMPDTIDWEYLLKDYSWLHWSAISPALNKQLAAVCREAMGTAKKMGLTISVDLNYRNRLWDYGKTPLEVMPELVQYCDVVMGNIWAANKMLGTPLKEPELNRHTSQERYIAVTNETAQALQQLYPNCQHTAFTFRFMDNPKHNLLFGTYHHQNHCYTSATYETQALVDRIGSGDAFMAGLLYGLHHQLDGQSVVDFATSAAYQKLFVPGDFGDFTVSQVQQGIR